MVAGDQVWDVAGHDVPVTHLDKTLWPAEGLTTGDLLAYYRAVAPVMLPHLAGRPITLRVYPEGASGKGYYRRSRPAGAPDWLAGIAYQPDREGKPLDAILIENEASLIWLANTGSIEFHAWSARAPDLDEPDQAILDLDPGEDASFVTVCQAAMRVKDALAGLGVRGYPKTSGGRGMHITVPLNPGQTFDGVREWVKAFGERLASAHPALVTIPHGRTHLGDLVTVDYAQNSRGRNTAAPYTVRGLPGAPVSAPVTWDEVASGAVTPAKLTMQTTPARTEEFGDLFAPVLTDRQQLPT